MCHAAALRHAPRVTTARFPRRTTCSKVRASVHLLINCSCSTGNPKPPASVSSNPCSCCRASGSRRANALAFTPATICCPRAARDRPSSVTLNCTTRPCVGCGPRTTNARCCRPPRAEDIDCGVTPERRANSVADRSPPRLSRTRAASCTWVRRTGRSACSISWVSAPEIVAKLAAYCAIFASLGVLTCRTWQSAPGIRYPHRDHGPPRPDVGCVVHTHAAAVNALPLLNASCTRYPTACRAPPADSRFAGTGALGASPQLRRSPTALGDGQ
jgi:hypothetical protein